MSVTAEEREAIQDTYEAPRIILDKHAEDPHIFVFTEEDEEGNLESGGGLEKYLTKNLFFKNLQFITAEQTNLQRNFSNYARIWKDETRFLSSIKDICTHSSYQRIIGMGPKVLPYILKELHHETNHWFWALKSISDEDPIRPENKGKVERMKEDWLRWGRSKGLI